MYFIPIVSLLFGLTSVNGVCLPSQTRVETTVFCQNTNPPATCTPAALPGTFDQVVQAPISIPLGSFCTISTDLVPVFLNIGGQASLFCISVFASCVDSAVVLSSDQSSAIVSSESQGSISSASTSLESSSIDSSSLESTSLDSSILDSSSLESTSLESSSLESSILDSLSLESASLESTGSSSR